MEMWKGRVPSKELLTWPVPGRWVGTKVSALWSDQQICHLKMGQEGSDFLLPLPFVRRGQAWVSNILSWPWSWGWRWWQKNAVPNPLPGCESTQWNLLQFTSASNCSHCYYAENLSGHCKWISVGWCACRSQGCTCWMQMMEHVFPQRSRCGCFPDKANKQKGKLVQNWCLRDPHTMISLV